MSYNTLDARVSAVLHEMSVRTEIYTPEGSYVEGVISDYGHPVYDDPKISHREAQALERLMIMDMYFREKSLPPLIA